MKKLLFTILFAFPGLCAFSQLDYLKIRDTLTPSMIYCGVRDSASLSVVLPKLLAIDTNLISKGIEEYYLDLAKTYTDFAMMSESDTTYRKLALDAIKHYLFHDPDDYSMIWNAGFDCVALGDCEQAHYYLRWYGETAPRKKWKKDQIGAFLSFCPDDELKRKFRIK